METCLISTNTASSYIYKWLHNIKTKYSVIFVIRHTGDQKKGQVKQSFRILRDRLRQVAMYMNVLWWCPYIYGMSFLSFLLMLGRLEYLFHRCRQVWSKLLFFLSRVVLQGKHNLCNTSSGIFSTFINHVGYVIINQTKIWKHEYHLFYIIIILLYWFSFLCIFVLKASIFHISIWYYCVLT